MAPREFSIGNPSFLAVGGQPKSYRFVCRIRTDKRPSGSLSKRDGRPIPPRELERLREPVLQEFPQFGRRLELRNRLQFLERRCERV